MAQTALSHPKITTTPQPASAGAAARSGRGVRPGLCAGEMVRCGAQVVGFDLSFRMVHTCRARVGQGDFRVHDLAVAIEAISA
jgi:hypothetical protein